MKGPFYRAATTTDQVLNATYYRTSNGQKFKLPLPYYKTGFSVNRREMSKNYTQIQSPWGATTLGSFSYYAGSTSRFPNMPDWTALTNKAYARWLANYRKQLQLAVDMVELRKTLQLLTALASAARRPLRTVAEAWHKYHRKLKKGGPTDALSELLLRDVPDAWLAFHFGLEPLFQTLHDGLKLYSESRPPVLIARGTAKATVEAKMTRISGLTYEMQETAHFKVKIQSEIVVTNPNAFLASQLGVINPASVAWELVPFSFLVDWFVNIGQMIATLDDTAGILIKNGFTTQYSHGGGFNYHYGPYNGSREWERCNYTWVRMSRVLGVTQPKLRCKIPKLGIVRTATAFALLAQQFAKELAKR